MTNVRVLRISPTYVLSYMYIRVHYNTHKAKNTPWLEEFKKLLMVGTAGSPQ